MWSQSRIPSIDVQRPIPDAWRLRAPLPPALRRGFLCAIPVGGALLVDLEVSSASAGAISTGALLAGFVAFDAPPRTRLGWQILTAPAIGVAAGIGALTGSPAWLAAATIAAFGSVVGLSFAVSLRLAIAGITVVLALLLAQGLSVGADDAPEALLLGLAGAALQALFTLASGVLGFVGEPRDRQAARKAAHAIRAALETRSPIAHHALRWGVALGVGTIAYHVLDLGEHGYWIPLTVLFVLRPTSDETVERIAMRAVGTLAGLAIGTPLAELLGEHAIPDAIALGIAAAFAFALLALEYALFTTAITAYVVLLAHALGQSAFDAADERALGTAIGIAIVAVALLASRTPPLGRGREKSV